MSTSVGQPNQTSSWKQEVSLRIAAHKSRSGCSTETLAATAPDWAAVSSRAAQAAARVAAHYAQAPSYSQMQAAEAQAVQRTAEFAPSASLKVDAAAQPAAPQPAHLESQAAADGSRPSEDELPQALETERAIARDWEPAVVPHLSITPSSLEDWESECSHTRSEPDLLPRPLELVSGPASAPLLAPLPAAVEGSELRAAPVPLSPALASPVLASTVRERWEWPALADQPSESDSIEPVEPDLPIHANLIEFPRELVAARKMRPRRAEGPFAAERSQTQLSIFEVDPGAISTRPEPVAAAALAAWPEPVWSAIELEPQLQDEAEPQEIPETVPAFQLAPFGHRFSAALIDGALVAATIIGLAMLAVSRFGHPPVTRIVELGAVAAILLAGLLYHALFLTLAIPTPGMKCAGLSLCTLDGQVPTRAQSRSRLGALLLSVVPVGFGLVWALFDDDHLCWHDRLSKTYLRKN